MTNNVIIWGLLLATLVASAASTFLIKNLLHAAIALAVTSAVLTVVMFLMGATLAAVLELSVCAGLITAVFASTISMVKPATDEEMTAARKQRVRRIIYLPFLLAAVAIGLLVCLPQMPLTLGAIAAGADTSAGKALWESRQLDVLGQVLIVLAGVFGVVVLFKGKAVKK